MLIDFQALFTGMARQQLNLGVRKFLAGQKRQHLMAEDMRVDGGLQPGGVPVVLHNLLHASHRVRAAALRLKDKAVGGVRREMRAQHQPKGVWIRTGRVRWDLPFVIS